MGERGQTSERQEGRGRARQGGGEGGGRGAQGVPLLTGGIADQIRNGMPPVTNSSEWNYMAYVYKFVCVWNYM